MRTRSRWIGLTVPLLLALLFLPHAFALSNDQAAGIVIGESSLTAFNPGQSQTALVSPSAEAFDSSGNLWVVDEGSNRVLEYKAPLSTGEAASLVIGQTSFDGSAYATSATGLDAPQGIAFDPAGNLWIADAANNRILEYKLPFSNGEAASIVIGQQNFTANASATTATGLNQPEAIAFDSSGDLWVGDSLNDRVLEYKTPLSTGEAATLVIGEPNLNVANDEVSRAGMSTPSGLAFDSSGNLWVADGIRVLEYKTPFATHEAASVVIGQNTFTNSSIVVDSTGVYLPYDVAFDSDGNLWVSDSGNNRILEFTTPFSNGEVASTVIGQPNFTSMATTPVFSPTATGLNGPRGIVFDSSGNLWVADYGEARVLGYGSSFPGAATSSSPTTSTSASSPPSGSSGTISTTSSTTTPSSSTSSVTTTTTVSSTTLTTTSSTSTHTGGVPVFPYQFGVAIAFTVVLAASFLWLRGRAIRGRDPSAPRR